MTYISSDSHSSSYNPYPGDRPWFVNLKFLYVFISFVNFLNYLDRGIIPGAPNDFDSFIQDDIDTSTPDVYLGILQSSFVVGYMAGSLIFGHYTHSFGIFKLISIGLSIWVVAIFFGFLSKYSGSYVFLLFTRMFSGFGEASLQCTIPPWIQNTSPKESKGKKYSNIYFFHL